MIERAAFSVALDDVRAEKRAHFLSNPADARQDRVIAPQRMTRLQKVIQAQQGQRAEDGNPDPVPHADLGKTGQNCRQHKDQKQWQEAVHEKPSSANRAQHKARPRRGNVTEACLSR